ncbi:MAG: DUF167 domain-containing protein [Patescibacteria group bacterium]
MTMDITVLVSARAKTENVSDALVDENGRVFYRASVKTLREKGRANEALCRLLAKHFSVPLSSVKIKSGHTSKIKRVRIV